MRISETLELNIPDDMDVNKLERYLAKEINRFGKQVFGKVLQEIETKKLEEARGKVGRREKVPRYLFTRLELIKFERHKVKYKEKGEDDFEAKLGIIYSGKELESKKAKHRRYRLKDKVIYGGIEGAEAPAGAHEITLGGEGEEHRPAAEAETARRRPLGKTGWPPGLS